MKVKNMMLGLLAFVLMVSVSSARPSDYDNYVRTGGCLRYLGPEETAFMAYPKGNFEDYKEVEFSMSIYRNYEPDAVPKCPKENGVPVCA